MARHPWTGPGRVVATMRRRRETVSMTKTPPARRRSGRPRDQQLDAAILSAGLKLLIERGAADTSIEQIAQQANVTRATVYRRFPNKTNLLIHAIESAHHELAPSHHNGKTWPTWSPTGPNSSANRSCAACSAACTARSTTTPNCYRPSGTATANITGRAYEPSSNKPALKDSSPN